MAMTICGELTKPNRWTWQSAIFATSNASGLVRAFRKVPTKVGALIYVFGGEEFRPAQPGKVPENT